MNDAATQMHAAAPHRARPLVRGSGTRGGGPLTHAHLPSKNKTWVSGRSPSATPEGKWERGRGISVRGAHTRGTHAAYGHASRSTAPSANGTEDEAEHVSDAGPAYSNGAVKTWEELVKAREVERARAIREGKMDDPTKPKRLDEAITIVGTCQDMCPEFERYRRERENNLDKWECLMGPDGKPTKKVDHRHAVKIYERGQGDKIVPSDLRPAPVLKMTLDYLFHDLILRGGFPDTQAFVRDRSRAVRNDFTIQQDKGPVSMECHERCTRFHILSLHLLYGVSTFDRALEIQQLMNSLLSLKEFYDDQRDGYQSPAELEMRIYHRLGLIRDQQERNDKPPPHIAGDPAFQLITRFRREVQAASSPITKTSSMKVNDAAMQTFAELAGVLRARGNVVMIYLVACFLEHIFGKDTIEDLESVKGSLTIQDIIDGNSEGVDVVETDAEVEDVDAVMDEELSQEAVSVGDDLSAFVDDADYVDDLYDEGVSEAQQMDSPVPSPLKRGATQWLTDNFGIAPTPPKDASVPRPQSLPGLTSTSPFGGPSTQSIFGSSPGAGDSVFGKLVGSSTMPSAFGAASSSPSIFGGSSNVFAPAKNVFGGPVFGAPSTTSAFPTAKAEEPTKQPTVSFPPQRQNSVPIVQSKPVRSSLADAAPLSSIGDEDRVPPSEAIRTPPPPPPFASSHSAPVLNASAPPFMPGSSQPSLTYTPPPANSRANLAPLQTDSLLQNVVDPVRRTFATPTASSSSFPSFSPYKPPTNSSLSINTGVAMTSTGQTRKAFAIDSPVGPPPLSRKAPISLPGTPTGSFSADSVPPVGPSTPISIYDSSSTRPSVPTATTSMAGVFPSSSLLSIGSPERIGVSPFQRSPSSVFSPPTANRSPLGVVDMPHPPTALTPGKSKADLQAKALTFERRLNFVRESFTKWRKRASDAVSWKEACRRSDAYKQKLKESTSDDLPRPSSSSKRRREAPGPAEPSRARRRLKNRVSQTIIPRTDEELAERLAQNKKVNERRWARGSFVSTIREHVQVQAGSVPQNWTVWLCMNAYNDQTAIWLEQKFDVPKSGTWESEAIFQIPVSTNPSVEGFPGLIIFECTPLEGVSDEIEKKYRILDDCSRLRDIVSMLPDRRHFVPSLLLVNWDSSSGSDDISDMVVKYVQEKTLRDVNTLSIKSDDDLVLAFVKCLTSLDIDLQGELVERLVLKDLFKRFMTPWRDAVSVWIDACTSDESFNWAMFSHVLEAFTNCLNAMMKNILAAWKPSAPQPTPFPQVPFGAVRDERSVVEIVRGWLRSSVFDQNYLTNNFSAGDFHKDFEARTFFDHLLDLAFLHVQNCTPGAMLPRAVTKAGLERSSAAFSQALEESQKQLNSAIKALPPPPRISEGRSIAAGDISMSAPRDPSPTRTVHTNGAKRARVSLASEVSAGEREQEREHEQEREQESRVPPSPTPSAATSVAESSKSSLVTLAMLRELSRSVLKTYGSSKSA